MDAEIQMAERKNIGREVRIIDEVRGVVGSGGCIGPPKEEICGEI
jgi:hypothetical protein